MEEELRINVDGRDYMVHFRMGNNWNMMYDGSVYPSIYFNDGEFAYQSNFNSDPVIEFDKEKVRCLFNFSYNWRGVWEGRVYPKDEEYWSEELREMADLWDKIEKIFKQKIKDNNPEYKHFDE